MARSVMRFVTGPMAVVVLEFCLAGCCEDTAMSTLSPRSLAPIAPVADTVGKGTPEPRRIETARESVAGVRGVNSESSTAPAPSTPTSNAALATLGAKVYAQRCALCHGANGKGDGPAAAGLNPKPRNHTDGAYMNSQTDAELLSVIHNGKGGMPAWRGTLSEREIRAVLVHVRSLAVPPYRGTARAHRGAPAARRR